MWNTLVSTFPGRSKRRHQEDGVLRSFASKNIINGGEEGGGRTVARVYKRQKDSVPFRVR